MSETDRLTGTPGSPHSMKRKPVPTPRSTLRKPSTSSQKMLFLNREVVEPINIPKQRNLSFDTDGDSQVTAETNTIF